MTIVHQVGGNYLEVSKVVVLASHVGSVVAEMATLRIRTYREVRYLRSVGLL